jgi:hypothetical protein
MLEKYEEEDYSFEKPVQYGDTYFHDYICYHKNFPEEWAVNHRNGTGPSQCENCFEYGSVNGVFIGYCVNCAQYDYSGKRGRGFIDSGIELKEEDCSEYDIPFYTSEYPSIFETYLKGVDITKIGVATEKENQEKVGESESEENHEYPELDEYDIYGPSCTLDYALDSCIFSDFDGGYNDY